ncbi:MAG: tetratricopeptide repeat protein [Acidobacteria bacterium]|nr:tetratricopeptide repeat protein [Acidobacteriota bacterium]
MTTPALAAIDAQHYVIDAELLPEVHQLRAQAQLTLLTQEPIAALRLTLNRNLRVERVLDAKGKPLVFEALPGGGLQVTLAEPLRAQQPLQLTVEYEGRFDPALRPESGPLLARIAPGATYLTHPAQWFPQTGNPWDRFTMELRVTVPAGETALTSNSSPTTRRLDDGREQFVFTSTESNRFGTLVVGKYEKISLSGEGVPITLWLRTIPGSVAPTYAETLGKVLVFFSEKFGPLAQAELAVAEIPDDNLDAYSAPSLLLLPARQWTSQPNYRLLAREAVRQWWAFRTSPATVSDAWLDEGLARYSEALYVEHTADDQAFRQVLEDLTIGALIEESAAPIANADQLEPFSPQFRSVVRDKGAMVVHMLRFVLGDETFLRVLKSYAERFAGRSARIADFERLAEEVSSQPLDYFFGEWLRSTGIPEFKLEYVVYRTQKGFRIGGQIRHELEVFRMPLDVRVETEGPPETARIEVAGQVSDFSIDTFGKPLSGGIRIDPNHNVLHYTDALRIRVAIARGESRFEQGEYLEAIREYQKALEVRRTSSLAHYRMGETFFEQRNYQAAANAFREAINGDKEPAWTVVWSHIFLGKIFDLTGQRERALNEYRRAIESGDDTAGAQAEAEKYLSEPYRRAERTIPIR